MQVIAVVGGGLIGQGWAVVFAQSGYEVAIYDPSADLTPFEFPFSKDKPSMLCFKGKITHHVVPAARTYVNLTELFLLYFLSYHLDI